MNFLKMNLFSLGAGCNRTASILTPNEKGMGIFGRGAVAHPTTEGFPFPYEACFHGAREFQFFRVRLVNKDKLL